MRQHLEIVFLVEPILLLTVLGYASQRQCCTVYHGLALKRGELFQTSSDRGTNVSFRIAHIYVYLMGSRPRGVLGRETGSEEMARSDSFLSLSHICSYFQGF